MADFQVIRRKSKQPTDVPQDLSQEDQSSLLSKAGAGAMSGLHTIGSILSWPSRLLHGGINAAVGGKEGFGENYLNPFDSRGGVEGSRHLINAGILAENNPNEWEWGDLGRGLADIAMDPTTFAGPGLTKAGMQAAKLSKGAKGALAAGRVAQTEAGQRALLNIGLPFSEPMISIGTGKGTADALRAIGRKTKLSAAADAIKNSYPARAASALFDYRTQGITHPTAQKNTMHSTEEMRALQAITRGDTNRAIRSDDFKGIAQDDLRRAFENAEKSAVEGGYVPHSAASDASLDPHVMLHINPQGDILKHFPNAADNGMLDDALKASQPITAPFLHLDASGNPVLGKGMLNPKVIQAQAKKAYKADYIAKKAEISDRMRDIPQLDDNGQITQEWADALKELHQFERGRKANIAAHAKRIADEIQGTHGTDEALATLAKMRDLQEPGMAVMVPASQAEQVRRLFSGGERKRIMSDTTKKVRDSMEFGHIDKSVANMLNRDIERGIGLGQELHDKTVKYFPRRESITKELDDAGDVIQRGSSALPVKLPGDTARKWIFTGHHEGTEGVNKLLKDPVIHDAIASGGLKAGEEAIRQRHGHMIDGLYQDKTQRAAVKKTLKAANQLEAKIAAGQAKIANLDNDALKMARQSTDPATVAAVKKADRKLQKMRDQVAELQGMHEEALKAHENARYAGHDRIPALAKYIKNNPELRGVDKFGNHPLVDLHTARLSSDRKYAMSDAVTKTLAQELNKGDGALTLRDFLSNKGFKLRTAAERIAGKTFDDAAELKAFLDTNKVDSKLAAQLNSLTPSYKAPEAVNDLSKKFKSFMAWWKGSTLAMPSSRSRDAIGGYVWNLLHGWGSPSFYKDAKDVLTGKVVTTNYSHVPEIKDWLAKSGKQWSPENQTEAIRQLIATHIPSDHNVLADVPVGQVGAGIEQLSHNIPGTEQTSLYRQFIGDPLRALAGKDPGGASWFGRKEPGDTVLSRAARAVKQPFVGVRGVGDAAETTYAPIKASEIFAANSDAYNRAAPFLQQMHGGTAADVAASNVNKAQIDYNPETFSATERWIKNNLVPFYSYNSRIIPETARQLSNFGSPTSQLIKAIDRSHGGGDPSVPDYVMSGSGIPLGLRPDGTKTYLTGLGQMYEPAVSQLGLMAGSLADPRSLSALAYDNLATLNPLIGVPLQRAVGQSFFQRGEPISNLDPIIGRTLSNVGEAVGLRSPEDGPVRPVTQFGRNAMSAADALLGATPFSRDAAMVRTLADPRKDALSKIIDTMTGAKVADVSPEKQMATLQKRAEDLARTQGAWEQRTVGFPKEQLARLALTNPELAAEQKHLQDMITAMKRKRTIRRKQKKAESDKK